MPRLFRSLPASELDPVDALCRKLGLEDLGEPVGRLLELGRVIVEWLSLPLQRCLEFFQRVRQALVDQGDVDEAKSTDLDCVGKAITAAARRGLDLT